MAKFMSVRISGAPGSGKSKMLEAFKATLPSHSVLELANINVKFNRITLAEAMDKMSTSGREGDKCLSVFMDGTYATSRVNSLVYDIGAFVREYHDNLRVHFYITEEG